jgi:hypothetical protein
MKTKINIVNVLILIAAIVSTCNAQGISKADLVGDWQIDSPVIANGWGHNYTFHKNNTFEFRVSQFEYLNRELGFGGTYTIKDSTVVLNIKYEILLVGGVPSFDPITIGGAGWYIAGGKIEISKLNRVVTEKLSISRCEKEDQRKYNDKCIAINLVPFYKVHFINPEY